MTDIETRLSECYANVFPVLAAAEFVGAGQESLEQWDPVAHTRCFPRLPRNSAAIGMTILLKT